MTKGQPLPTQSYLQVPGFRVFLHAGYYLTLCRDKAQPEAADIPELAGCTHHNGISGFVSQHSPGRSRSGKRHQVPSCKGNSAHSCLLGQIGPLRITASYRTQWLPRRTEAGEHEAERLSQMYWKAFGSLSCKTAGTKKLCEIARNLAQQTPVQVTWTSTGEG